MSNPLRTRLLARGCYGAPCRSCVPGRSRSAASPAEPPGVGPRDQGRRLRHACGGVPAARSDSTPQRSRRGASAIRQSQSRCSFTHAILRDREVVARTCARAPFCHLAIMGDAVFATGMVRSPPIVELVVSGIIWIIVVGFVLHHRARLIARTQQPVGLRPHRCARHCGFVPCDLHRPNARVVSPQPGSGLYRRNHRRGGRPVHLEQARCLRRLARPGRAAPIGQTRKFSFRLLVPARG